MNDKLINKILLKTGNMETQEIVEEFEFCYDTIVSDYLIEYLKGSSEDRLLDILADL